MQPTREATPADPLNYTRPRFFLFFTFLFSDLEEKNVHIAAAHFGISRQAATFNKERKRKKERKV